MKFNIFAYIKEMTVEIESLKDKIAQADDLQKMRQAANLARGTVNGLVIFLNSIISQENNGITEQLDELSDRWLAEIYGEASTWAHKHGDMELFRSLAKKRDMYMEV